MKILVADDNDLHRQRLIEQLKALGHDVHEARDGREAREVWHGGEFQLVVLDWKMCDRDDREFCRLVRAVKRLEYTYLILLISRSRPEDQSAAMSAGADKLLPKPCDGEELARWVGKAERMTGLRTILADAPTAATCRDQDLKKATRAKAEFLAQASHDLRAPLNQILGLAQLLEQASADPEFNKFVRTIVSHGVELRGLIDDVLQATAPEPGSPGQPDDPRAARFADRSLPRELAGE